MTSLFALYRQSVPETVNSAPLVLGLFQTVTDAQAQLAKMQDRNNRWRPPRPGHQQWELRTNRYLYVVEEFPVHADETQDASASTQLDSSVVVSPISAQSIRMLMSHVCECLDESADAARESHENWMAQSVSEDDEHLRRLQGNERYYLGQAAAFAWMAGCLERLMEQNGQELEEHDDAREPAIRPDGARRRHVNLGLARLSTELYRADSV